MRQFISQLYTTAVTFIKSQFTNPITDYSQKKLKTILNSHLTKKSVREAMRIIRDLDDLTKQQEREMIEELESKLKNKLKRKYKYRYKAIKQKFEDESESEENEEETKAGSEVQNENEKNAHKSHGNFTATRQNYYENQFTMCEEFLAEAEKELGNVSTIEVNEEANEWHDVEGEQFYDCIEPEHTTRKRRAENDESNYKKVKHNFLYYEKDLNIVDITPEYENDDLCPKNIRGCDDVRIIEWSNVPSHLEDEYYSKENVEKIHAYKDKIREERKLKYGDCNTVKLYNEIQNKLKIEKLLKAHRERMEREAVGKKLYRKLAKNIEPYEIEETSKWYRLFGGEDLPKTYKVMVNPPEDTIEEYNARIEKLLEGVVWTKPKRKSEEDNENKKVKLESDSEKPDAIESGESDECKSEDKMNECKVEEHTNESRVDGNLKSDFKVKNKLEIDLVDYEECNKPAEIDLAKEETSKVTDLPEQESTKLPMTESANKDVQFVESASNHAYLMTNENNNVEQPFDSNHMQFANTYVQPLVVDQSYSNQFSIPDNTEIFNNNQQTFFNTPVNFTPSNQSHTAQSTNMDSTSQLAFGINQPSFDNYTQQIENKDDIFGVANQDYNFGFNIQNQPLSINLQDQQSFTNAFDNNVNQNYESQKLGQTSQFAEQPSGFMFGNIGGSVPSFLSDEQPKTGWFSMGTSTEQQSFGQGSNNEQNKPESGGETKRTFAKRKR